MIKISSLIPKLSTDLQLDSMPDTVPGPISNSTPTWKCLDILSYGAGTPSTTLALMSCENIRHGPPYPNPKVPIYDAVIFCDLHSEPSWVYAQAEFTAAVCQAAGIPFYWLDSDLYGDFTNNFGRARTACLPFWTLSEDGKRGRMPRQCTYDYKIKVIEKFVRYELLFYRPRQRTIPLDIHAHRLHMGIMWEERQRAKESKQRLFVNRYPLVEMGWTRAECYKYNKEIWSMETRASCCLFCPFHTNFFYHYIREYEPHCYACACLVDELIEKYQARPPVKSKLFLSKSRKRLRDLSEEDCQDAKTFLYYQQPIWNGF